MQYLYQLTFPTGKKYIGVSYNPQKRFREHIASTRAGSKLPVHEAFRLYGEASIEMKIIGESFTQEKIAWMEIEAIQAHDSLCPRGYNVLSGGRISPMHNPEVRAKVSALAKARGMTPAMVAASFASRGMKRSPESLINASNARLGKCSEKQRSYLTDPATRARLMEGIRAYWERPGVREAASKRQKERPISEECRARIGKWNIGKVRSEDLKKIISAKMKGKPKSEETKHRMREAWKKRRLLTSGIT